MRFAMDERLKAMRAPSRELRVNARRTPSSQQQVSCCESSGCAEHGVPMAGRACVNMLRSKLVGDFTFACGGNPIRAGPIHPCQDANYEILRMHNCFDASNLAW